MIRALVLAVALSSASSLAVAKTAPTGAQTPEAAAEAQAPGEAEFEARAEAFGQRIQAMGQEMQAVVAAAGSDTARRDADLDAVEARYQPDVEAFATALEVFVDRQAAAAPQDQRAGMTAGVAEALPQIRAIPGQVRAQIVAAAAPSAAAE